MWTEDLSQAIADDADDFAEDCAGDRAVDHCAYDGDSADDDDGDDNDAHDNSDDEAKARAYFFPADSTNFVQHKSFYWWPMDRSFAECSVEDKPNNDYTSADH